MIKLNVQFDYPNTSMHFNLHIRPQEKVALIGPSGSGKSSLLNLIAGFELPSQGEIWLNGKNHTYSEPHLRPVSILFQENNLFPHLTVQQNIALSLTTHSKLNSKQLEQVENAASAVSLQNFLKRRPTELSGGQKQRVALARCLLRDKPILLLDEPFSSLDPDLRSEMFNLIDQLCNEKQLTMLLVTHQPKELEGKIDRTLLLEKGRIRND
ncbi:thiamine ABC transporter ATP-binding protein [Seminibacterium arietis]|uniref:Thiamine ABC transporter ATP-binding protein n=1 Tax=Seminibacterium arietis TaxID=1173502 RepID=A0ABW3I849_9PAST